MTAGKVEKISTITGRTEPSRRWKKKTSRSQD